MNKTALQLTSAFVSFILIGCAHKERIAEKDSTAAVVHELKSSPAECSLKFYSESKPHEFAREVERLETILPLSQDSNIKAKAHLRLALLHFDHKNPDRDYNAALKELETYVSLDPAGARREEVQNLLAILREIGRYKAVPQKNDPASSENKELKKAIEQLLKENREMKKTLEDLKSLDLKIEEKRRQIK